MVGDAGWEEQVLGEPRPVLVEFWSPTCAVCRAMEPRFQRLMADYSERVAFFRANVLEEEDLVWAYDVMSTPTFVALRDGEVVGALAGEVDQQELASLLEDALSGSA